MNHHLAVKGLHDVKNVLIIQAHPSDASLCHALADAFEEGVRDTACALRRIDLHRLSFDPILHHGNRGSQALEPDLVQAKQDIAWADHLVFVYPNWWGSMPALLKGFFDRLLLPGFAYKYRPNSRLWDKLLAGRTAQLLVTMDTPGWYYRWLWHRPGHNQMRHTILGFCGIAITRISEFAPVHGAVPGQRDKWLKQATSLGLGLA